MACAASGAGDSMQLMEVCAAFRVWLIFGEGWACMIESLFFLSTNNGLLLFPQKRFHQM